MTNPKPMLCDDCLAPKRVLQICERCHRQLCPGCAQRHRCATGADTAQLKYDARSRR